ncbi:hypothetical protein BSQ38_09455 [Pediococcus damnosus]|uniref:malonate decarboxylase holo-ACP synthase n=1 Tax=Pediococcus damnosus TaxID=51663 RepID=UPI000C1CC081|nr:malonate decarboxylase holo-ACP synthase [Pediococcus damnosus]PIO81842.1 hypothetical protein BSQ38_09455 [Pediococcus damnosus]
MELLPHDLIKLGAIKNLKEFERLAQWAKLSLVRAPWVVVRRGYQSAGMVPVGIRGNLRNERQSAMVSEQAIVGKVSPFDLVLNKMWLSVNSSRKTLPVFQALDAIAPIMRDFSWGIGGSYGYELVSGVPMAKVSSDLDIIVQNFPKVSVNEAQKLLSELNQYGVHIDLQVVEGQNGFSLEEYAHNRSQTILMKTEKGPQLVPDPWER